MQNVSEDAEEKNQIKLVFLNADSIKVLCMVSCNTAPDLKVLTSFS